MSQLPEGWTLERVQEMGRLVARPRLVEGTNGATVELADGRLEALRPSVIIDCGGLCLVLDADSEWYMGQPDETGIVRCWASYGPDLDVALRAL